MAKQSDDTGQSGGIQSLDAALRVLALMAQKSGPVTLSDLAREIDMPPSKVHRYLASFMHAGLVEQAGRSGKYDLGAGAVALGLSAISRQDFVNRASAELSELRDETGLTVLLSVWGNEGATVVRWERAASPVVTSMGLGTTLPLLNSSAGRAFLAWGPRAPMRNLLEVELRRARKSPHLFPDFTASQAGIDALVRDIRQCGYAAVFGNFIPGLVAVAAPVLDWQGEAQAVVTLVGTDPEMIADGSAAIRSLSAFCQALSFARIISDEA